MMKIDIMKKLFQRNEKEQKRSSNRKSYTNFRLFLDFKEFLFHFPTNTIL